MVVPLGPGKFYGSSLPRPRYTQFNSERVNPPVPVLDSFLSWANDAHWSMGGLNVNRVRLQGRIEGNIKKLREENEKIIKNRRKIAPEDAKLIGSHEKGMHNGFKLEGSLSPPNAPNSKKRRRLMSLIDEDEDEDVVERGFEKNGVVRKLGDEFDRVASESVSKRNLRSGKYRFEDENLGEIKAASLKNKVMKAADNIRKDSNVAALRTGGKKLKKIGEKSLPNVPEIRTSPRLSKNRQ